MATNVVLNAVSYSVPAVGESNWGTNVSSYLVALASGVLQKAGGSFTLTADTDFGASYGLKSVYFKSRGTVSTAGVVRLANAESVGWRNAANDADKLLKVNSSDLLEFDSNPIVTLALGAANTVLRMNGAGTAYAYAKLVDANIASAAAIAVNKLAALTASRAAVFDSSGFLAAATTTSTEIGYVNGVTSAIQTQIDAKLNKSGGTMTGDLILAGDPDSALKAATKQYVDSVSAGLDVKPSVKCATTANITLSGEQTLDGVLTSTNRVLVKNQSTASQNGIYVSAAGSWTRATDMDAWTEVPGAFCFVENGTLYADTAWVCTADLGGTIGSTSITWSQFAGAGTYAAGQGLTLTGTTFSITVLTASRAVVTDGSGNPTAATTTATEIGYVNGVTSAIQTQLGTKASLTGVEQLTNKDIDGGTASNSLRITVPKNTTTNLTALTRKQGTIVYDTDLGVLKYDTGAALNTLATNSAASPTAAGIVTTFVPVIASATKAVASANYTILDTDGYHSILVTTGNSQRTITLPAVANNTGRILYIKKMDSGSGSVLVDTPSTETIDGNAQSTITAQYAFLALICDGTNWNVINYSPNAQVRADTGAGFGSGSTKIRRFTNFVTTGTGITGVDSSTLGTTFTINEAGIYACTYSDLRSGAAFTIGISQNSNQLTTSIGSITTAHRIAVGDQSAGLIGHCGVTVRAAAGDVIRPHSDANEDSTAAFVQFTITQVARL